MNLRKRFKKPTKPDHAILTQIAGLPHCNIRIRGTRYCIFNIMDFKGLREAIPPAYTKYIGEVWLSLHCA
jgi:hypothetical protein